MVKRDIQAALLTKVSEHLCVKGGYRSFGEASGG